MYIDEKKSQFFNNISHKCVCVIAIDESIIINAYF